MTTAVQTSTIETVASTLAPEDIRCGDMVCVLNEILEYPAFLFICDSELSDSEPVIRVKMQARDDGRPLKIRSVCLPFVMVESPHGGIEVKDVRSTQFVRLDAEYADQVVKALKKGNDQNGKKKTSKSKKKKKQ